MKLLSKLTLFITLSKLVIVVLFVLILPSLVEKIAFEYTNYYLKQQKSKVLNAISRNGIGFYLQGEETYGSYTMLKEEYISLEPYKRISLDTIETAQRLVEQDTLTYRVLSYTFREGQRDYLLEIGKTTATISQYNKPLQRIALYVLVGLILLTVLMDLLFTHFLLKPLGQIIATKLIHQRFPFTRKIERVRTSTTDFKSLDNALISLMEQVNDAFEKEREFTANASHELMTPISILKSKIENLMLEDEIDEGVLQRLTEMMKTVNRLGKIVHSLLLISRIDNEQFIKDDRVKVGDLLLDVKEEIEHRLEEKGISLSLRGEPDLYLKNCNKDLLFQCFYNLLTNAVRYNKINGSITIDWGHKGTSIFLNIRDSGSGIDNSELPFIFNRFRKANRADNGGYGLGLAIVKSIADYHGIEISVKSVMQEGTLFTLLFPAEMTEI